MELIPLLMGLLTGILTSYTDIKTGFVFDVHAFPTLQLIGKLLGWEEEEEDVGLPRWIERIIIPSAEIGILYYLYLGLKSGDVLLALSGLIGLFVGFGLGLFLYYIGAWASGDVVILAAFSALLPWPPDRQDCATVRRWIPVLSSRNTVQQHPCGLSVYNSLRAWSTGGAEGNRRYQKSFH